MPERELKEVTFTINGKVIKTFDRNTVLAAALDNGIYIPHFCYHPDLENVGQCRLCLVEIEGKKGLHASCTTFAEEGMRIVADSEAVKENQNSVMEFLLINHPLDCPICDKSGDCPLQNHAMSYRKYDFRFYEDKTRKPKTKKLGTTILIDEERCIVCTRCVRFTDDISRTGELFLSGRGYRTEIDVFETSPLNNAYMGSVVDICPVGALLDIDTYLKIHPWELTPVESVCPGCSTGCGVYHDVRANKIWRTRNRPGKISRWICDSGRYCFHHYELEERVLEPLMRVNERFEPCDPSDVKNRMEEKKNASCSGFISAAATCEEAKTFKEVMAGKFNATELDFKVGGGGVIGSDKTIDWLRSRDTFPNAHGLMDIGIGADNSGATGKTIMERAAAGHLDMLLIVDFDLLKFVSDVDAAKVALKKIPVIIYFGDRRTATSEYAHFLLPFRNPMEKDGHYVNRKGVKQSLKKALVPPKTVLSLQSTLELI